MEELRRASIVYYNACSKKQQKLAKKLFEKIDTDGNGWISVGEFTNYLSMAGLKGWDQTIFSKLDKDNNGFLDFNECLFFFYLLHTRPGCDACGALVLDMHYSCVKCYRRYADGDGHTFDLCPSCHSSGNFNHKHGEFLDNYALLRSSKSKVQSPEFRKDRIMGCDW